MAWLTKASEILAPWLQQSGLRHHLLEQRLRAEWAAIAGALIATHCQPLRLRHRRLTIAAESPAWRHQLHYLEPVLLEQIRRAVGPDLVTELHWMVGPPEPSTTNTRSGSPSAPGASRPLDAEAQAAITAALTPLRDPQLAERVRRLMEKALSDPLATGKPAVRSRQGEKPLSP
jgi:hypothetical protein